MSTVGTQSIVKRGFDHKKTLSGCTMFESLEQIDAQSVDTEKQKRINAKKQDWLDNLKHWNTKQDRG